MDKRAMDGGQRQADPHRVTSFGRLIREQRDRRRMSQDAVVAAAKKAGYPFGKSRLSQLETEALPTWPGPNIIKGLSAALEVPERVLSLALLESMGLDIPQMPSSDWMLVVSKAEQMPPAQQRRLRRVVENLLDDGGENE